MTTPTREELRDLAITVRAWSLCDAAYFETLTKVHDAMQFMFLELDAKDKRIAELEERIKLAEPWVKKWFDELCDYTWTEYIDDEQQAVIKWLADVKRARGET